MGEWVNVVCRVKNSNSVVRFLVRGLVAGSGCLRVGKCQVLVSKKEKEIVIP